MLQPCWWADICGQLFPRGTGSFIIRLSVSNAFLLLAHPTQTCSGEVSGVDVMFELCWPEVTGVKDGLGLLWACLFSTEGFWIVLPLQRVPQGHELFITWVGRCIFARSLLSPQDEARPCCLGTKQEWPPWVPLCQEHSGEQPELLAKKCSHRLTFSLFQIFSWKQMTCLEWNLHSSVTELCCES